MPSPFDSDPSDRLDRLARKRAGAQLGWFLHAAIYLAVNLGLAALALGTGHRHGHWPVFPALGWGLGLLAHGAAVWMAGPGGALREWMVARERARLLRRQERP